MDQKPQIINYLFLIWTSYHPWQCNHQPYPYTYLIKYFNIPRQAIVFFILFCRKVEIFMNFYWTKTFFAFLFSHYFRFTWFQYSNKPHKNIFTLFEVSFSINQIRSVWLVKVKLKNHTKKSIIFKSPLEYLVGRQASFLSEFDSFTSQVKKREVYL